MNEMTVFNYEADEVRMININGDPWFVAKDVCDVLELVDVSGSLNKLDSDEKLIRSLYGSGQSRDVWTVNESGLYTLIMRSNKPEAKKFRRWVTKEVLPSVRKTGSYSVSAPKTYIEALESLLEVEKEKEQLLLSTVENKPKVEYYEKVSNAVNYHSLLETAKILGTGRNNFMKDLRAKKILMKTNIPYQRYIDSGYFVVKERAYGGDLGFLSRTTFVTGKGIQWLFKLYDVEV